MVKLKYVGVMANGIVRGGGLELAVQKGEVYEVSDDHAEKLLNSGEWEKIEEEVKVYKKKKKTEEDNEDA